MATREERKQRLLELLAVMHELMCDVHDLFHEVVDVVDPSGEAFEQACDKLEDAEWSPFEGEVPPPQ